MNGISLPPTQTSISSQHIVASPTDTGAQLNLQSMAAHDCKRDIVCGGAVATGVPYTLTGKDIARHGRVASRNTTVPDSTWHGVS